MLGVLMSDANKMSASASPELPAEVQGIDICPEDSVFNCETEGVVMTGKGCARMYSVLDGIQTIAALLFQRELDRGNEGGIVIGQNVSIGLLNALGSCAELASILMNGQGGHSRTIATDAPEYLALVELARGTPGKIRAATECADMARGVCNAD
jgi:hypothetical protein